MKKHFDGIAWGMAADAREALAARIESIKSLVALGALSENSKQLAAMGKNPIAPTITDGVACFDVIGDIIARASFVEKIYANAIDPFDIANTFDALAKDPSVKSAEVLVDSNGGTISGSNEARASIARFQAAGKTLAVHIVGTMASATYWIFSGADKITATQTSKIGSLGVCYVPRDTTEMQKAGGVRREVIASGQLKALGEDGAITPEYRDQLKRSVDSLVSVFRDAVASGRGLSGEKLDAVFSGDVWHAKEAKALGLIDEIEDGEPLICTPSDQVEPKQENETPDASASAKKINPSAAADIPTEARMDPKLMAALAALCAEHPTQAAALVAKANAPGATAEDLHGIIAKAKDEALAKATATIADLTAKATASDAARVKAESDLAALKAHGTLHNDPGPDASKEQNNLPKFTNEQAAKGQIPAEIFKSGKFVIAG
jgi:signal peptide peptidase SppA